MNHDYDFTKPLIHLSGDNENGQTINILLVEDNLGDIRLTLEALKEGKVCNQLLIARDGVEAMDILTRQPPYADLPRPDLILLDLNMPRKDGREVLAEIKNNPSLKRIPVVILTTSKAEEDVLRSYDLHANCYITKPVDLEQFMKVIASIKEFWLSIVKLPEK